MIEQFKSLIYISDDERKSLQNDVYNSTLLQCPDLPGSDSFEFELLNDSNQMDRFILESAHKKIRIKGNNNNSLAVGLNHYLKYYCHTNVSWYASDSIDMPEELPVIPQPISIRSKCDNRFFLNYCTFGYTMPLSLIHI